MKSLLFLILLNASLASTIAIANDKRNGDALSFEINQLYNSDYSAWGNEVGIDYRPWSKSNWHLQVSADYFDKYHHEDLEPALEHAYGNLRTGLAYRWQPSYLFNVTAKFGAASSLVDVEALSIEAGEIQGYAALLMGYKIHSKIELQTGVVQDFGSSTLDGSSSFLLGIRLTPGAKRRVKKKVKTTPEADLNQITKEFGWPNDKAKRVVNTGKKPRQVVPAASPQMPKQSNPATKLNAVEVKGGNKQSSKEANKQLPQALAAQQPEVPERILSQTSNNIRAANSGLPMWPFVMRNRPELQSLAQVYSIQIGTFADPKSIPLFLTKHKFSASDVFVKLSGKYRKLYTGLYANEESAQQVQSLLNEAGISNLLVSLKVEQ